MAITKIVTTAEVEGKNIGQVANLKTTEKTNLVGAINELSDTANALVTGIPLKKVLQSEYDALPDDQKNSGILYAIEPNPAPVTPPEGQTPPAGA